MLKNASKIIFGLSVLLFGGLTLADGQIPSNSVLKANIPFSFMVQNKTLPAGEYTIRETGADIDSDNILEIVSNTGKDRAVLFQTIGTITERMPKSSELVFDKVGDSYFLSKIFVAGDNDGSLIEPTKTEKKLGKGSA